MMMANDRMRCVSLGLAAAILSAAGLPASAQCPTEWLLASAGFPNVPTDPPVRQNHAAAFDAARGQVVLFGGYLAGTGYRGDTWTWDGESWTLASETGPIARSNPAMAYDAARGRVILFGGNIGVPLDDTWAWDGTTWTQLTPPTSPPGRFNHAMAYDSVRGVIVMTGGYSTLRHGDTWEFDGTTWTERPGASYGARSSHGMAFDERRGVMVVFGGFNGARLNTTYELTPTGWVQVMAPDPLPLGRQYLGMDYDPVRERVVLWGGQIGAGSADRAQDTWLYDGQTWTEITPANPPPKRDQHTLTFDRARGQFVIFGGYQGAGLGGTVGDTWTSACGASCYPNCDGSTAAPVLNVNDFICFQSAFAAGDPYANCDGSTSAPVLNVNDFICFQSAFAAGCP